MDDDFEGGIEWSIPVLARRDADGRLIAEIPDAAAARLELDEGDVICYGRGSNCDGASSC